MSSVGFFVAEKYGEYVHRVRLMNGFENNAIPARYLAVLAFVVLSLERLHETPEWGAFFEHGDIVKYALPPVGRYSLKLFCGAVVNVDDPDHVGVGRA